MKRTGKREKTKYTKIAHNSRHPYIQEHKVIKIKLKLLVTSWQLTKIVEREKQTFYGIFNLCRW